MAGCSGCEAQLSDRTNIELLPALAGAPIACPLGQAEFAERAEAFHALFAALASAERLQCGFRWTFHNAPGVERSVRRLARYEHSCCPFLSFAVSTHGDRVVWEAYGPDGAEDIVHALFDVPASSWRHPAP